MYVKFERSSEKQQINKISTQKKYVRVNPMLFWFLTLETSFC